MHHVGTRSLLGSLGSTASLRTACSFLIRTYVAWIGQRTGRSQQKARSAHARRRKPEDSELKDILEAGSHPRLTPCPLISHEEVEWTSSTAWTGYHFADPREVAVVRHQYSLN